ncbi:MAG TPA: glycosyltransferase family 2 protein [Longimicrobiales bacterium]|nr:glycosyltransferase family 2 protein [Longimicrobiales bacterium]
MAIAAGNPDDGTRGVVEEIDDPRVRIVDAVWDEGRRQLAYADMTNAALDACSGDWCLYVQADEVLHEEDHETVRRRCAELLDDRRVDGMLFDYLHFFGDYEHVQRGQGWYAREIRIIRNGVGIRSVRDAQSFRRPPQRRITVAPSRARIFHYGWVRHPRRMQSKVEEFWSHRIGKGEAARVHGGRREFDYGPLGRLPRWEGSHPRFMAARMAAMDWRDLLRQVDPPELASRPLHRDERPLYRFLTSVSRLTGVDLNHKNHGRVIDV